VVVTGRGIGTAAYLGFNAARSRGAIVSKVGDAGAYFDRGFALHDEGKLAEAIDEYRAALRNLPGSAEIHNRSHAAGSSRARQWSPGFVSRREGLDWKTEIRRERIECGV
jgi:hypothetical protein